MSSFRLTNAAESDLFGIGRYTEERWGTAQRTSYLTQLDESFHLLAKHPDLGTRADEIRAGYRWHPEGQHVIFYRRIESGIEVVRVLHRKMQPKHHFLGDS